MTEEQLHLYDLLLGTKISIVMVNAQSLNLFYRGLAVSRFHYQTDGVAA